jgi:two-component system response regulator FlrC
VRLWKGTLADRTACKIMPGVSPFAPRRLGDAMSAVNQTKEILVIEDDQASREAICDLLELEGYLVASVSNGQEGLDHLRLDYARHESRTGLILLDLSMPVMDGWEFLQRLQTETCPRPPVVVMSAGVSPSPTDAQAVLRKPVNIDQLMSTIAASFDCG